MKYHLHILCNNNKNIWTIQISPKVLPISPILYKFFRLNRGENCYQLNVDVPPFANNPKDSKVVQNVIESLFKNKNYVILKDHIPFFKDLAEKLEISSLRNKVVATEEYYSQYDQKQFDIFSDEIILFNSIIDDPKNSIGMVQSFFHNDNTLYHFEQTQFWDYFFHFAISHYNNKNDSDALYKFITTLSKNIQISIFEELFQSETYHEITKTIESNNIIIQNEIKNNAFLETLINDDADNFISLCNQCGIESNSVSINLLKVHDIFDPYSLFDESKWKKLEITKAAAFFGSIKCFKYLLLNDYMCEFTSELMTYAISGGNLEIFHILCKKMDSTDSKFRIELNYVLAAVAFHRNNQTDWLLDKLLNYGETIFFNEKVLKLSIRSFNFYFLFRYIIPEYKGCFHEMLQFAYEANNIFLVKWLINLKISFVNQTFETFNECLIHKACEDGNIEIVKILTSSPLVNVNIQRNAIFFFF